MRRSLKRNLLKGRHTMEDQKQIEEMTFREMMDELDGKAIRLSLRTA